MPLGVKRDLLEPCRLADRGPAGGPSWLGVAAVTKMVTGDALTIIGFWLRFVEHHSLYRFRAYSVMDPP